MGWHHINDIMLLSSTKFSYLGVYINLKAIVYLHEIILPQYNLDRANSMNFGSGILKYKYYPIMCYKIFDTLYMSSC